MEYPKYEKVNEHTIRVISEKAEDVPVNTLLETLKQCEAKKVQLEQLINNIKDILKNADELGITPEEKK
jgi:hypothetical protein